MLFVPSSLRTVLWQYLKIKLIRAPWTINIVLMTAIWNGRLVHILWPLFWQPATIFYVYWMIIWKSTQIYDPNDFLWRPFSNQFMVFEIRICWFQTYWLISDLFLKNSESSNFGEILQPCFIGILKFLVVRWSSCIWFSTPEQIILK